MQFNLIGRSRSFSGPFAAPDTAAVMGAFLVNLYEGVKPGLHPRRDALPAAFYNPIAT